MADDNKPLLTVNEAAEIIEVSPRQVRNLITSGLLKAEKMGRDYMIRRSDLQRLPADRKPGPKPRKPSKS